MNNTLNTVKDIRNIHINDYEWELSRISSLTIFQEGLYVSDLHFEAFLDILGYKGHDRRANFNNSDEELMEMLGGKVRMAELTKLNGGTGILVYNEEDIKYFTKYYPDYPVYLLTRE